MTPDPQIVDAVKTVIRGRRTVQQFQPQPAPHKKLLEAIELAIWAPNHKLTEPWRFHLIGPQTAAALIELNARLMAVSKGERAAEEKRRRWSEMPGWFAVSCRWSGEPVRNDEDYAACCCAVQNLALCLWSEGIGLKWTTGEITRNDECLKLLGLDPTASRVVGLFWYGYPASIPDQKRSAVEEFIDELP